MGGNIIFPGSTNLSYGFLIDYLEQTSGSLSLGARPFSKGLLGLISWVKYIIIYQAYADGDYPSTLYYIYIILYIFTL